ncbi:MAG: hypothetical protein R3207_12210 [Oceanospirillum sp.]|nr:hypothetical protein [Oceanospirillum sp.]
MQVQQQWKSIGISAALAASVLLTGCMGGTKPSNPHMTEGTPEFQQMTQKMEGMWKATSYKENGQELLGSVYKKVDAEFVWGGDTSSEVAISYYWTDGAIDTKFGEWQADYPELHDVSVYGFVWRGDWWVGDPKAISGRSDGGTVLSNMSGASVGVHAEGDGPDFPTFFSKENARVAMNQAAENKDVSGGSLGSMFAKALVKDTVVEATKDNIPVRPSSFIIRSVSDNQLVLSKGEIELKLKR